MGFTTPSYSLKDLFSRAGRGELQLPDFQREYLWDVDRVRTLVTSVLRGYPVGSFLALDTRNTEQRFKPRPLEGVAVEGVAPGLLLLDGQQRLTSLYQAFKNDGEVHTVDYLGRPIRRRFMVDVRVAVSADPMPVEALFAVDEQGQVRSHFGPDVDGALNSREAYINNGVIPVSMLLWTEGNDLLVDMAASTEDEQLRDAVKHFVNQVMRGLPAYDVPVIRVDRETTQAGVGQIFAFANSAGVQMDVFELLTAVFASEDPSFVLAENWRDTEHKLREHPVLDSVGRVEFLRALSLLLTSRRGSARGHRGDILDISLEQYRAHAGEMLDGFLAGARFLEERRVVYADQVPYPAQLIPLAVILARLAEDPGALEREGAADRLNRWFWCGVFGELYGSHAPTIRIGLDVTEVTPWVRGDTDELPRTVADAQFFESRLRTAGPDSGVYRGLYSLLMARGARDWRTAEPFTAETVGQLQPRFRQVFPTEYLAVTGALDTDPELADSVLNRTPMGRRTDVVIERNEPKRYLPRLQSKSLLEDDEFDAMLEGHEMDPELVLASDWEGFVADRRERFVGMIEYAMDRAAERDWEPGEA
ncbi:GmrSD restriction endonuclease domain-containing protein [Corynebacterium pilbarense]